MSSTKDIDIDLEGDIGFGDTELNKVFKELDEKSKKEILAYDKDKQIEILKNINNPERKKMYDSLSQKKKANLDAMDIRNKYILLGVMVNKEKNPDVKPIPENLADLNTQKKELDSGKVKIGIIVPFRESDKKKKTRTSHLEDFRTYMAKFLAGHDYKIYVVEQSDDRRKFNRGQLLNIGFELAAAEGVTNFIFHDVDLLPSEGLKQYYTSVPKDKPVHIAGVLPQYNNNSATSAKFFGGVVSFNAQMFRKVNGYPNNFWGWGGEDEELLKRVKKFYNILKVDKGFLRDLEEKTLKQKQDYLNENKLLFDRRFEALEEHANTWKTNGLNTVNYILIRETKCGSNCEQYLVELNSDNNAIHMPEQGNALNVDISEEFQEVGLSDEDEEGNRRETAAERFNRLVKFYFDRELYRGIPQKVENELEVRFGTKNLKDVKRLTKNDYDNVIKVLKSFGFETSNPIGMPVLKVNCEFLDSITGRFKISENIRTEIHGLVGIEEYCRSNDIKTVYDNVFTSSSVKFIKKGPFIKEDKSRVMPVDMNDFNFRVSLQAEEIVKKGVEYSIMDNWRKSKKEFRYVNRVSFEHPDYPLRVDLSITKMGKRGNDKRGFSRIIPVSTLEESELFNNPESYEIEIEVLNNEVGPGTSCRTAEDLLAKLRLTIKYVLTGLQGTAYPVSYPEQSDILSDYMKLIWEKEYDDTKRVTSQKFIGPNSITLQLTNIAEYDENSGVPNIRKDFVVTDKADGARHLLYVAKSGKIYLISSNMDIKFTGAKTLCEDCYNTLLDGELIKHNKEGEFINLYAAFDAYYYKGKDIRDLPLIEKEKEKDKGKEKEMSSRLIVLNTIMKSLKPVSIMFTPHTKDNFVKKSPIRIEPKRFYPISSKTQSIFEGCKDILEKERQGLFEYEIDGLIFTHMYYGVGSNTIGKAGPKNKITWEYSFKWKPPQFNTIDFLVTTVKTSGNEDVIKSLYEDGISASAAVQHAEYKVIELRCGFSQRNDGYINPLQDIIDDIVPEYKPREDEKKDNDYEPKRFYPTEPFNPNAGLCNIMLNMDDAGTMQMFTLDGETFGDNTIVEFSYDLDAPDGWGWKPLRVRHDKTAKLRRGEREYGNSYKVCNENWKSIHPTGRITEDMLMTGEGIPDINISEDIYYNTPTGRMKTEALKNFHNLYVKKLLITGAGKSGDTLIDFACGKAGDLPKWIAAKLSFVFGIDLSTDNIENRFDGACVRYLNAKKVNKRMPSALFVNGNTANNIMDGTAMLNDKAKMITFAVFGNGPKDPEKIGKGVAKQYGKGDGGFNVTSCQFAIHYFFKTPDTLKGFLKNVAECTKINGYFIGTSYDGKTIFDKLKKVKSGSGIQIVEKGKKIWEVIKVYTADDFTNDSSSIGYEINVYQESINQYFSEYLVNYDYLDRLMDAYGFKLISIEEANEMGLPAGTGMFRELFTNMLDEISKNRFKSSLFGEAPNMTKADKDISFLNRYFVYKKVREVNINKLNLELGEYEEALTKRELAETKKAVVVAVEEVKEVKPKVRKLSKKLLLVPATEAVEEMPKQATETKETTEATKTNDKETAVKKPRKIKIIGEL